MKLKICVLLLLTSSFFFSSCEKKEKPSVIYGKISNAEKSFIYLQKISEKGEETLDSVMTDKDGKFEMNNPATTPDFFILRANTTNLIFLLLKKGERVEVNGDAKNFELTYKVKGSKDSELIKALRNHDRVLSDSLNKVYEEQRANAPEQKDVIGLSLQKHYAEEMESFSKKFIRENISSLVALSATKFINQQAELSLMNELKDSLFKAYPDNKYVQDYISLLTELQKLPAGSMCPDISLSTPDGNQFSLSSLKGKVVLIDFWASWCTPCRRENPRIVEIYNRYKGDHFEIFGVSLDENIAAWKNAIVKDKITWPQVSDLKRWNSSVVSQFHIEAIPYNLLIDRDGKIIAKGLRSEELEPKIAEAIGINQ